jgi:hypothetical protein
MFLATVWAVTAIIVIAQVLVRRYLAARALRRDLDHYLQWLLDEAEAVTMRPRWPS